MCNFFLIVKCGLVLWDINDIIIIIILSTLNKDFFGKKTCVHKSRTINANAMVQFRNETSAIKYM